MMNGKIVYDLEHPQLVVLAMLRERNEIPYRAQVAAIQSFLNCYYAHDWESSYFPYRKITFEKRIAPSQKIT